MTAELCSSYLKCSAPTTLPSRDSLYSLSLEHHAYQLEVCNTIFLWVRNETRWWIQLINLSLGDWSERWVINRLWPDQVRVSAPYICMGSSHACAVVPLENNTKDRPLSQTVRNNSPLPILKP